MRNRLLQHWSFLTQTAQTPDSVISLTLASRIQKTHRFEILKFILNQADVEFGFGTDKMKQILGQTDISPSKAAN